MYSISCFFVLSYKISFVLHPIFSGSKKRLCEKLEGPEVSAKIFQYYGAHEQEECIVFERKICCLKIQTTFSKTLDVT